MQNEELIESIEGQMVDDRGNNEGIAQALSSLIEKLGEDDDILLFSELRQDEIRHLSVLSLFDDEVTQKFTSQYTTMKVSHRRRGRQELIKVSEALGSKMNEEMENLRDKLMSTFR